MASAKGAMPVGRLLVSFAVLVALTFILVFLTGGKRAEPKLGIDLQGGTRVTLTARTPDGRAPGHDSLQRAQEIIESRVNGLGVSGSQVEIDGTNLVITIPGDDTSRARSLGQTARLYIRPVIAGPTGSATTPPRMPAPSSTGPTLDPNRTAEQIRSARATRQSTDTAVQRKAAAALDCAAADPLQGNDVPDKPLVACDSTGRYVYTLGPSIIDGQQISGASSGYDNSSGRYVVDLNFTSAASQTWADFTQHNVGKQAAFALDSRVVSAPEIQTPTPVGQGTQISGNFTADSAKSLANSLKYGSLPLSFASSQAQTVSATLGLSSLRAGLLAGAIGLIAVLAYCFVYYRALGAMVALSLICSGVMIFGLLVLLGRWIGYTLDLAGIAGLIIGIGMTADSFVVFFERIKDEIRAGRTFRSAVPRAWVRARRTIMSSNAVGFIASAVLYALAIGDVRGFAFTLGLTTVMDTIIVFLVTAPVVTWASRSPLWGRPSVNGLGAIARIARERKIAAAEAGRA